MFVAVTIDSTIFDDSSDNMPSNYFQELLKVMYMDPALDHLCDVDYNPCK